MNINTTGFMAFIAVIATIFFTVLAYKFIVPEKKRANLNKLGQFVHDTFNFKYLIVEKILQFLYVLSTIACICFGICMLFGISIYHSEWANETYTHWYGIYGILIAILGPIGVRISFEILMMFLLLVKNVIQINRKLKAPVEDDDYKMPSFKELVSKENFDFIKGNKAEPDAQPTETNEEA